MLAPLARARDGILGIGIRLTDRPDDRLRKQALVVTAVVISVLSFFWIGTYLWLGRPVAAAIPITYQVISVVGLIYFARTYDFNLFRFSQLATMLVLPFVLQWVLGGFVDSGAVMVWAFAAPVAALVLYSPRQAVWFFVAFLGLTIVSGVLDPALSARAEPLPEDLRLLFFVLDIGAATTVTYAVLQYFVASRERAQAESDRLLYNILPIEIADRLRTGEQRIADDLPAVTVLFADIAGFTPMARAAGADEVLNVLDRLFTAFDELTDRYGMEKIKTIGDSYMAAAGVPSPRPDHLRAGADMALAMVAETARVSAELGRELAVRIGLETGPAMAGVIGQRKFIYDLWGDAVNVASRMETHGQPGRIHVTEGVEAALRGAYVFEDRGLIEVKGLGEMHTYFLVGKRADA